MAFATFSYYMNMRETFMLKYSKSPKVKARVNEDVVDKFFLFNCILVRMPAGWCNSTKKECRSLNARDSRGCWIR